MYLWANFYAIFMRIAFFATQITPNMLSFLTEWIQHTEQKHDILLYTGLYDALMADFPLKNCVAFQKKTDLQADILVSLGGDGTILEAVQYILKHQVPILGINMGRLGFLANVRNYPIAEIMQAIENKNYTLEHRVMLGVEPKNLLAGMSALNEITVQKRDSSSMISIKVSANHILLNTYWADGIIISTPTGSTAYSLSCGGPIMVPNIKVICITPMAPHNLTVRPIILDINTILDIEVEGRIHQYMLSVDNQTVIVESQEKLRITQAKQTAPFILLEGEDFFNTLRNKLNWGLDNRP